MYIEQGETSLEFVNRFFFNLFMSHDLDGYTIYIHNLGRFDSIFILKSLILMKEITLTPIWKDNGILSLTIKYLDIKLTLLDSLQLIPGSLSDILDSFKCNIKKSKFPYSFVNKKNYFIKELNLLKFILKISQIKNTSLSLIKIEILKRETLSYLKSDVEGLLEAILKFRDSIHNKYSLNITKFKTLPGLTLAIYSSKYIPRKLKPQLKMTKGSLETKLRTSYFGGNVEVYVNEVINAFAYDMNSQYPKAMLLDMPVGNPFLSLETDLNKPKYLII